MSNIIHPGHSLLNSESFFVDGFEFEIVEFQKIAFNDFGINAKARYYLAIEGEVFRFEQLKKYVDATGINDWSIITADKKYWLDFINSAQSAIDSIERYNQRNAKGNFTIAINEKKDNFYKKFGIKLN